MARCPETSTVGPHRVQCEWDQGHLEDHYAVKRVEGCRDGPFMIAPFTHSATWPVHG